MFERQTVPLVEIPKAPALEAIHFISTANIPHKNQAESLDFLNDYGFTQVISEVLKLHGEQLGTAESRKITGHDFDQRFEACLHHNFVNEPYVMSMYVYHDEAKDNKPIYGLTLPILPNGSLDLRRKVMVTWGELNLSYSATDAEPNNPVHLAQALQGCSVRLGNVLHESGPTFAPAESEAMAALAA